VARKPLAPHSADWLQRLPGQWPFRPIVAKFLRLRVSKKIRQEHYPAPYALIDLWKRSGNGHLRYEAEADSIATLLTGEASKNLVRVFLLKERLRSLGKGSAKIFRRVHVIGGGTMGGDIAAWCALQGFTVTVQDLDHGRLAKVVQRAAELVQKKFRVPRDRQVVMDRLIPDREGSGIGSADMVIEAIFEDLEAKRALYRSVEPKMAAHAILATNTSSIPLQDLCQVLKRPERFVGLHFFNPVAKMELVEVVSTADTDSMVVAQAIAFVQRMKKLPLPVGSSPGFLVNRILMPYLLEAVLAAEEGIPVSVIDEAAVAFGMPMGPLLLADTVGIDICLSVARILAGHYHLEVPKRLEAMVAEGRLGRKSGSGFYLYKKGMPVVTKAEAKGPADLTNRLILRLLNEAAACLREQVALDKDLIDAGVIFGTGFAPFHGGPLQYASAIGHESVRQTLAVLQGIHGPRFEPDPLWREQ
jgi:3-hydroxyacyl-CoA dehydrogenase/enoyl-CoA hydratase/3-hydroxybutyryl-CoA epimerase